MNISLRFEKDKQKKGGSYKKYKSYLNLLGFKLVNFLMVLYIFQITQSIRNKEKISFTMSKTFQAQF